MAYIYIYIYMCVFPVPISSWAESTLKLPMNAKYTSPDIQHQVSSALAKLVKKKIAADIRNAQLYTIMADGTTDNNRKEIQGFVCRSKGEIVEHCRNINGADDRRANGVFGFIKKTLKDFEIPVDGIASQSYDGASVMPGGYNGLQALVSDFCKQYTLYVHCCLHKKLLSRRAGDGKYR